MPCLFYSDCLSDMRTLTPIPAEMHTLENSLELVPDPSCTNESKTVSGHRCCGRAANMCRSQRPPMRPPSQSLSRCASTRQMKSEAPSERSRQWERSRQLKKCEVPSESDCPMRGDAVHDWRPPASGLCTQIPRGLPSQQG